MRFFEELSGDSHEWEILGVRKVTVSQHPEDLLGEFFCISNPSLALLIIFVTSKPALFGKMEKI